MGLLYQQLVRNGELSAQGRLPPVFPLVLYNGIRPWQGSETLGELIEPAPGSLGRYQPSLSYLLVDEGRVGDVTLVAEQGNMAGALMQLENSRAPEEVRRGIQLLVRWLHAPEQVSLRRAFTVWLARVLLPGKLKGIDLPALNELEEVDAMLAERVKEWTREWEQQGHRLGVKDGEIEMLRKLLIRKFGTLPAKIEERLAQAEPEELQGWAVKTLFAQSMEEVFED